jgi:hypothetical protein
MMQMPAAAGLPIMADGERAADPDNPEGYYEWERIKQVGITAGDPPRGDGHGDQSGGAAAGGTSRAAFVSGDLHEPADRGSGGIAGR